VVVKTSENMVIKKAGENRTIHQDISEISRGVEVSTTRIYS
jgi:hypothetical protein